MVETSGMIKSFTYDAIGYIKESVKFITQIANVTSIEATSVLQKKEHLLSGAVCSTDINGIQDSGAHFLLQMQVQIK